MESNEWNGSSPTQAEPEMEDPRVEFGRTAKFEYFSVRSCSQEVYPPPTHTHTRRPLELYFVEEVHRALLSACPFNCGKSKWLVNSGLLK
jgi:hypothetical protein